MNLNDIDISNHSHNSTSRGEDVNHNQIHINTTDQMQSHSDTNETGTDDARGRDSSRRSLVEQEDEDMHGNISNAEDMNNTHLDMDVNMDMNLNSMNIHDSHGLSLPTASTEALPEADIEPERDDEEHDLQGASLELGLDSGLGLGSVSDSVGERHHTERLVLIPPPRQSEQTAREQLIERERQARLERERARLKRQLARLRARDEEDEAFADADIARVNSDDSIANTHTDRSGATDSYIHSLHDLNVDVGMNVGESMDGDLDLISDALHGHGNTSNVRIASRGDGAERDENLNNLMVIPTDEDDKSLVCTIGRGEDGGINGGNIDVEGHGNVDNESGDGHGSDRQQPSPSPLGFTMERFLQDGVVVRENESTRIISNGMFTQINRNGREGDISNGNVTAPNMNIDADVNMASLENGVHPPPPLMNLRPDNLPLVVPPTGPPALSIEPAASSIIVDQLSSPYPTSSHDEHDGVPMTPTHTDENRSSESLHMDMSMSIRVPSPITVLNASSLEPREEPPDDHDSTMGPLTPDAIERIGIIESINDNRSGEESDIDVAINRGQPRLAQLSEAEILDITEIDYASVGNMPPRSVRDERHLPDVSGSAFSEQTRTTILESVSATTIDTRTSSAEFDEPCMSSIGMDMNNSGEPTDDDCDDGPSPNVSPIHHHHHPHNVAVGVASIPPTEETLMSPVSNTSLDVQGSENSIEGSVMSDSDRKPAAVANMPAPKPNLGEINLEDDNMEDKSDNIQWPVSNGHDAIEETVVVIKESTGSTGSYALPNRTIRPGMIKVPPLPLSNRSSAESSTVFHRRAQTTPNFTSFVDDFDYCKYNDGGMNGHASDRPPTMFGPLYDGNNPGPAVDGTRPTYVQHNYGATNGGNHHGHEVDYVERGDHIFQPLMPKSGSMITRDDMVDSVFSSVRSLSTADLEAEINDCDNYLASSILARAFPERFATLVVTIIIEVPVLCMIAGGSDRLISLIGRDRYQLLIAFLPLSSALSGNCGLQASTLAIRAISHLHVTRANYLSWLLSEIGVASVLGLGLGLVVGILAYLTSNSDLAFAITMGVANFIGVLSAGLTGTLAPLICTFIFHRDASKWGGPLETAIQDNIATFAMIILSYKILSWLGPSVNEG